MPTHELPFFLTDDTSTGAGNQDAQMQMHNREVHLKGTHNYLPQGLVREWAVSCLKLHACKPATCLEASFQDAIHLDTSQAHSCNMSLFTVELHGTSAKQMGLPSHWDCEEGSNSLNLHS